MTSALSLLFSGINSTSGLDIPLVLIHLHFGETTYMPEVEYAFKRSTSSWPLQSYIVSLSDSSILSPALPLQDGIFSSINCYKVGQFQVPSSAGKFTGSLCKERRKSSKSVSCITVTWDSKFIDVGN